MKIAIIGSQNVGKSTLIEEFLKKWPMYKRPQKTYRDIIKEKGLTLNKNATKETQKIILEALVDEVQQACVDGEDFLIFDRCVIDNMAYTLWHYAKGTEGFSEEFIIDCKTLAAIALKYFDVVFYLPIHPDIPVKAKDDNTRDIDLVYREEIDNIFRALIQSYERNTKAFFPTEDCPAIITLEGPPDLRIPQIQLYVKENGKCYGEDTPSLIDPDAA
ncbi:MAG: hypothetical protein EBW87_04215 [Burkholderiaceae bacterium]|jgi:GTPase SAR1 family protein|nr:hypothetical protein [Burkholderiaceae bacterium]